MNRAAKVAKRHGMVVEIKPDGTIRLEPMDGTASDKSSFIEYAGVHL